MSTDDEERQRLEISILQAKIRSIELANAIDAAIREAQSQADATAILTRHPFGFTRLQAEAVLQMSIYQRTSIERTRLEGRLRDVMSNATEAPGK